MRALVVVVALLAVNVALPAQGSRRIAGDPRSSVVPSASIGVMMQLANADGIPRATDWSALGDSLRDVGRHREAIAAWERAMQLGAVEPARAAFNVARAYAHLENRRQSLRWLDHAVSYGLADPELVRGEREFERYRDDAWFRAILDRVGKSSGGRIA